MSNSTHYCQLIFLILRFTLSVQYRALHERFRDHYEAEKQRTDQKSVPFERVTQLYSKASKAHVQIIGRRVDALGEDGSPYGKIVTFLISHIFYVSSVNSPKFFRSHSLFFELSTLSDYTFKHFKKSKKVFQSRSSDSVFSNYDFSPFCSFF